METGRIGARNVVGQRFVSTGIERNGVRSAEVHLCVSIWFVVQSVLNAMARRDVSTERGKTGAKNAVVRKCAGMASRERRVRNVLARAFVNMEG